MHKIQNIAGRLIEIRVEPPMTPNEILQFVDDLKTTASRVSDRYVAVTDLRRAAVFPADVAATLIQVLSQMSSRVDRAALLLGESAVLALQIERVLRNAANPNRKVFREAEAMKKWLGEVLNKAESLRLDSFLAEEDGDQPPQE